MGQYTSDTQKRRLKEQQERRKERRVLVSGIKAEQGCLVCGESDPVVLDFHHPDPTIKHDTVANMVNKQRPVSEIVTEAKKCVVLCANCHRKVHAGRLTIPLSSNW